MTVVNNNPSKLLGYNRIKTLSIYKSKTRLKTILFFDNTDIIVFGFILL